MQNTSNYYRIKMMWKAQNSKGAVVTRKTEDLVLATSYTEAEEIAYELIHTQRRDQLSTDIPVEIIKTKISELLLNDIMDRDQELVGGLVNAYFNEPEETSGVGLYAVKILERTINEINGEEKATPSVIYTPAKDNADAIKNINAYASMRDIIIRDVKFDKAGSILLPPDDYQAKMDSRN